jgi:hypothetical protein
MVSEVQKIDSLDDLPVHEIDDVKLVDKSEVDELVWFYFSHVPLILVQILFYLRPVIAVRCLAIV